MRWNSKSPTLGTVAFATVLAAGLLAFAQPAPAQVTRADEIVYPPMPSVEMPQPERVVLKNGMVVLLLEDHELPLVEARMAIRTGSRWEPADKVGLAELTGQLLRSGGTENQPSDALDDWLEDRAARIETFIGTESGTAQMSCLAEDVDEVMGQFADILRHPAFEADKLEVAKTQAVAGIARQNDSPGQIRGREFGQLIYGEDSPYARVPTYATLEAIGRDDLVAWHGKWFQPDRMILGLVGDFEQDAIVALVEKHFGDWAKGPAVSEPAIEIAKPKPGVYHAVKNDVTQATIALGHLGIRRDNPDYFAVELMNQVLGGSFAARLFSRVRSQQGLAYNVTGSVRSSWDHVGVYQMNIGTKVETTAAGIEALIREARNMTTEPPTDEEVTAARTALLNSFVFRADSTSRILRQQMEYEYYGYPLDWLERYRQEIEKVTTAQVREVAAKYIHPDDFVILVVGPEEGLDKPLDTFGEVQILDISISEPEGEVVEMTAEAMAKGRELVARALAGIGGAEAVDAVTSMRSVASVEMQTPQGAMELQTTNVVGLPDRVRMELTLPFGTMVQVLGPAGAFGKSPRGVGPLPESQQKQMKEGLLRLPVVMLQMRHHEGLRAAAVGTADLEGETLDLLRVEIDGSMNTFGIDAEGHIRTIEFRGQGLTGAPGTIRQVYSDFREVGGLMLPFLSETTFEGDPMMSTATSGIELNVETEEALFLEPAA